MIELFTASGTQQDEIFGVAASGRTAALPGINVFRVRDGRITERWGRLDELTLMRQPRAATPQVSSLLLRASGSPARSPGSSPWSSGGTPPARSSRSCISPPTPSRST